jgi:hypothetical protein
LINEYNNKTGRVVLNPDNTYTDTKTGRHIFFRAEPRQKAEPLPEQNIKNDEILVRGLSSISHEGMNVSDDFVKSIIQGSAANSSVKSLTGKSAVIFKNKAFLNKEDKDINKQALKHVHIKQDVLDLKKTSLMGEELFSD